MHLVRGQDAGGEDRERAVLVPGRNHRAGERDAAFDDELLHELGASPRSHNRPSGLTQSKRNSHLPTGVRALRPATFPARHRSSQRAMRRRGEVQSAHRSAITVAPVERRSGSREPISGGRVRTYTRSLGFRPRLVLAYEHMFPPTRTSGIAQRALGALRLTRSFLLLEDDYDADWEVDVEEPAGHPHRAPLRSRLDRRRPGVPAPSPNPCLTPIPRKATTNTSPAHTSPAAPNAGEHSLCPQTRVAAEPHPPN